MDGKICPKMEFEPPVHLGTGEQIFQDFPKSVDSGSSQFNCVVFLKG